MITISAPVRKELQLHSTLRTSPSACYVCPLVPLEKWQLQFGVALIHAPSSSKQER